MGTIIGISINLCCCEHWKEEKILYKCNRTINISNAFIMGCTTRGARPCVTALIIGFSSYLPENSSFSDSHLHM